MQPRPLLSPPLHLPCGPSLVRYLGAGCMGFLAADGVFRCQAPRRRQVRNQFVVCRLSGECSGPDVELLADGRCVPSASRGECSGPDVELLADGRCVPSASWGECSAPDVERLADGRCVPSASASWGEGGEGDDSSVKWHMAANAQGVSCDEVCACASIDKNCVQSELDALSGQSDEFILAKVEEGGQWCSTLRQDCEQEQDNNCVAWGSPYTHEGKYCYAGSKPSVASGFVASCSQTTPIDPLHRRLCPCK